ncbi:MAG: glycosyltransferase family 39 protein [Clostridiales bacterium]|nr:glycosyltransferase family 39 protein [Clostridiales bacterium]
MVGILVVAVLFAVGLYAAWSYCLCPQTGKLQKGRQNAVYIIAVCVGAFVLRVILAAKYMGHSTDMNCFMAWSDMIFKDGIPNFYTSDAFTDYPPGYMYVLYVIGGIEHLFGFSEGMRWLLIKLPAIICDIVTGIFIYRLASKKLSDAPSAVIAAVYVFNPAVIINSSLWGQVDAVYTLFIILMIYMLDKKRLIPAYFLFALCIFIKPQAFIFTPLVIYAIAENVFLPKFDAQKFIKNLAGGLGAITMIVILALPFGIGNVTEQYKNTLASYPYLTVNAFNIWGAFGQNWTPLTPFTSALGYVILAAIVAYTTYVFFKTAKDNPSRYYFAGALLSFSTYMLSTKMHDRYAFAAMALLLIAFVRMPDMRHFMLYAFSALLQYFNAAWVLFIYEQDINKYFKSPVIIIGSVLNIALYAFMIAMSYKYYIKNTKTEIKTVKAKPTVKSEPAIKAFHFGITEKFDRLKKTDYIIIAGLMVLYSCIALYHLGNTSAPQTYVDMGDEKKVTVDLGEDCNISKIKMYLGPYQLNEEDRKLEIAYVDSAGNRVFQKTQTDGAVFCWNEIELEERARYITLSTAASNLHIMELGICDDDNQTLIPKNASDKSIAAMFDEQDMVPERKSYLNSTYFDEIYHARTAYEFIHHLPVYEWTHPPLGKIFISLGIRLFGMTPFGWRIVGTVFGILMIPVIYVFASRLLKKQWLAAITAVLLTFDFMHFAQTRIATIDVYVTFFIMLMYYFMYRYCKMSFNDTPIKKTLIPLSLSGICMGLGIACKWTGMYAGCGLAVIFFAVLYKRYKEYLYAKNSPSGSTDEISHSEVVSAFKGNVIKTLVCCVIFFVLVPACIYVLSYIPYLQVPGSQGIKTIIDNQNAMWTYHSKTVVDSTHPFSSHWYEWIIMKRPIWYYSGTIDSGVKEGISSFGNPLVWWMGIPAFFYMIYLAAVKKDRAALFLAVAYLAELLPWVPVERTTYIYHYFPCVPFLVLMIGYSMLQIYSEALQKQPGAGINQRRNVCIMCFVYAALVVGMFAMFYPVLSGAPCSVWYAEHFLKWFDSWVLL